jgi:hypothetical protein
VALDSRPNISVLHYILLGLALLVFLDSSWHVVEVTPIQLLISVAFTLDTVPCFKYSTIMILAAYYVNWVRS